MSWLHHEAEVVRDSAEQVVQGAVEADPDDEYLVGLAGALGGGDSYLVSVDRHLLDLPEGTLKDGEGRTLARILTPRGVSAPDGARTEAQVATPHTHDPAAHADESEAASTVHAPVGVRVGVQRRWGPCQAFSPTTIILQIARK